MTGSLKTGISTASTELKSRNFLPSGSRRHCSCFCVPGKMPLSQSSTEYIARSGSIKPRGLQRINAAAASENKAIESFVSSGFSISIFKSHRTFVLVRSHTNPKTLAGRPLRVASFAIVAAVRMVAKPPAQPIPLRSRLWASG